MSKLALRGGTPVREAQFPVWPVYDENEENALIKVLSSRVWGTLGSEVRLFEKRFADYQNTQYGICVTNGTVTLEIILRALGIGYGDEVIIPPYTFNATASSVIVAGATPVFADIEAETFNICPESIEKNITSKTKAIIPVHVGGLMCDMDRIMRIADKHGLYVIEDAAHAHGSEWRGKRSGSIGHAGSFSFQASKNLTAGEGGFISVNSKEIYEKCWAIHHCGRDKYGKVWYEHPFIGTNARMTEWQAAILNTQLDRLDAQIEKRMLNAAYLDAQLAGIECIETVKKDERVTRNSYHLFLFRYISEKMKNIPRKVFLEALTAEGIPCSPGYACLYKQKMLGTPEFKRMTGSEISFMDIFLKSAEKAAGYEGAWLTQNLLLGEKKDIDHIVEAIRKIYVNSDELI